MLSRQTLICMGVVLAVVLASMYLMSDSSYGRTAAETYEGCSAQAPPLTRVSPRYAVYLPKHLASARLDATEGTRYLAKPDLWPRDAVSKQVHGEYTWIPAVHEDSLHDPYVTEDRGCSTYQPRMLCPETDEEAVLHRRSQTCEHVLPQEGSFMR